MRGLQQSPATPPVCTWLIAIVPLSARFGLLAAAGGDDGALARGLEAAQGPAVTAFTPLKMRAWPGTGALDLGLT